MLVADALAPQAAFTADAPGKVSAPLRPKGTDDGQERERGEREEVHGRVPEELPSLPPPQEPNTKFYDLDDVSVPELGGTRPDRLADVRL